MDLREGLSRSEVPKLIVPPPPGKVWGREKLLSTYSWGQILPSLSITIVAFLYQLKTKPLQSFLLLSKRIKWSKLKFPRALSPLLPLLDYNPVYFFFCSSYWKKRRNKEEKCPRVNTKRLLTSNSNTSYYVSKHFKPIHPLNPQLL